MQLTVILLSLSSSPSPTKGCGVRTGDVQERAAGCRKGNDPHGGILKTEPTLPVLAEPELGYASTGCCREPHILGAKGTGGQRGRECVRHKQESESRRDRETEAGGTLA